MLTNMAQQSSNQSYAFFHGSRPARLIRQINYICLSEKNFAKLQSKLLWKPRPMCRLPVSSWADSNWVLFSCTTIKTPFYYTINVNPVPYLFIPSFEEWLIWWPYSVRLQGGWQLKERKAICLHYLHPELHSVAGCQNGEEPSTIKYMTYSLPF